MVARADKREAAARAVAGHLLASGLAETGVRRLAEEAGLSDRMLLYHFETKADVLREALGAVARDLLARLELEIPLGAPIAPHALFDKAAALTTGDELRSYMRLWTEVVAASANGEEPYAEIVGAIAAGFLDWIEARLAIEDDAERRDEARALFAMIDGLAILSMCAPQADVAAARRRLARTLMAAGA